MKPAALLVIFGPVASALAVIMPRHQLPPPPPRSAARGRAALTLQQQNDAFQVHVDLGEGSGYAQIELDPYFSDSDLVTLRLPLPFELEAEPIQGVYKVVKPGYGLLEGDVLRAFSTMVIRYDSQLKSVRCGPGVPGQLPGDGKLPPQVDNGPLEFLTSGARRVVEKILGPSIDELGAFAERKPAKCLFVADGQPHYAVEDALVANVPDKTNEIVMIFERPYGRANL